MAATPALAYALTEAADEARALELRAEQADAMKEEVPQALRERAPNIEGPGWVRAMRYRIEQLEREAREKRGSLQSDVEAFHHKFGHPVPGHVVREMDPELARFRARLVREEANELAAALYAHADTVAAIAPEMRQSDLAHIAGEAVDLIYVALGTLVAAGLPLQPFWDEVQRANMAKEPNPGGGKPLKPAGWTPPDLDKVLRCLR